MTQLNFTIKFFNGTTKLIEYGSVTTYFLENIDKDFWIENKEAMLVNFSSINPNVVMSEILYSSLSKKDILLIKSKLNNIYALDLSYETYFLRLVISIVYLFEKKAVIFVSNVGLTVETLDTLEQIFLKYIDDNKALIIILE